MPSSRVKKSTRVAKKAVKKVVKKAVKKAARRPLDIPPMNEPTTAEPTETYTSNENDTQVTLPPSAARINESFTPKGAIPSKAKYQVTVHGKYHAQSELGMGLRHYEFKVYLKEAPAGLLSYLRFVVLPPIMHAKYADYHAIQTIYQRGLIPLTDEARREKRSHSVKEMALDDLISYIERSSFTAIVKSDDPDEEDQVVPIEIPVADFEFGEDSGHYDLIKLREATLFAEQGDQAAIDKLVHNMLEARDLAELNGVPLEYVEDNMTHTTKNT